MPQTYEPTNFEILGEEDKPFQKASQQAIDLLEGITPAQKGQAVPYVLIWEVDQNTGAAKHSKEGGRPKKPLSLSYVETPKFGANIDNPEFRFRERPPVSLERISIKSQNPRGIILWRQLEFHFTVHRPDVVFQEDSPDGDTWSSLIRLGRVHALEYGWSASAAVENGILNGLGYSSGDINIPGRIQIKFVVTNYTFNILPDNQLKFVITAFEDGEYSRRRAFVADESASDNKDEKGAKAPNQNVDPYANNSKAMKDLLAKVQKDILEASEQDKKSKTRRVSFGKVFDVLFASKIRQAHIDLGYSDVKVIMGRFNARAGKPLDKYGGAEMGNVPFSDFIFPIDDINKIFTDLLNAGPGLTLDNFLDPFINLFNNYQIWDRKDDKNFSDRTVPHVIMRTIQRRLPNGKTNVAIYIFDANREFTKFTADDAHKLPKTGATRKQIRDVVVSKGVPFVSLVRANSYVKSANFDTVNDEQMAGIFMRRALGDAGVTRDEKTSEPSVAKKENSRAAPQQIFSPVIQGNITMIGNFVFDVFCLLWLEFGVKEWDGPFNMAEREDVIEQGEFTTTIKIYSAGTDPLGTQGK